VNESVAIIVTVVVHAVVVVGVIFSERKRSRGGRS
jgi:hypothetical protein